MFGLARTQRESNSFYSLTRESVNLSKGTWLISVLDRNYLLEFMTFQWKFILELSWAFPHWLH